MNIANSKHKMKILVQNQSLITLLLLGILSCTNPAQSEKGEWACTPCGSACDRMFFNKSGNCPHCGMALIQADHASAGDKKNVAILLFNGVEILDFGGPAEVFAATGAYNVYTVAASKLPVTSQGFIRITPEYSIENCPAPDIIVLPGGNMMEPLEDAKIIQWVRTEEPNVDAILSVCTGAFILDKAGLLVGKKATTFHNAISDLRAKATQTEVLEHVRWVDNGRIITTAGVSAGIDGALRVVDRSLGREKALSTTVYMEYDKWNPAEGMVVDSTTHSLKM